MSMHNYVRVVPRVGTLDVQIVIPQKFLNTDKLKSNFPEYMRRAKDEALSFWKTLAGQKLNQSREKYIEALSAKQTGKGNVVLSLEGTPAVHIEMGKDALAENKLRAAFMRSGKLKPSPMKIKIPKEKRHLLKDTPKPFQWLIVPMADGTYRTFTTAENQKNKWEMENAANLREDVKEELKNNIIPKHMNDLIKDSLK